MRMTTLTRKFKKARLHPDDGLDVLKVLAVYATAISRPASRQASTLLDLLQAENESNEQDCMKVHRLIAQSFNKVLTRELDNGSTQEPHEHQSWLPAEIIYSVGNHWRLKSQLEDGVRVQLQEFSRHWVLSFRSMVAPRPHARIIHQAEGVMEMLGELHDAAWLIHIPPFEGQYELGGLEPENLWSIPSIRQSLENRRGELDMQLLKKLKEDHVKS